LISKELRLYFRYLRFRYISVSVKRTLKNIVKPKSTATPIQYQFLSVKMSELSSKAIPNLFTTPLLSYEHAYAHLVNKNI
jgi:hypothetical protein